MILHRFYSEESCWHFCYLFSWPPWKQKVAQFGDIDLLRCLFFPFANNYQYRLQLLRCSKHLQQSEIHTLIMQMTETERQKETKTITCLEQLQLKCFSHANIEPNELWQCVPPLATGVFNQLWDTNHCINMTEMTECKRLVSQYFLFLFGGVCC